MSDQLTAELTSTRQLWSALLPYDAPDQYAINLLLLQHGVETVRYAVEQVALKRSKLGGEMDQQTAHRLFGAVCCSLTKAKQHLAAA